ncbi:MAG: SDR family NAD(P)-dependent oxidoreductase [Hymenobacter sp.]|nr:SDR family NAD(P)-dependent oxidoreductase [Hymenobacter sp.]
MPTATASIALVTGANSGLGLLLTKRLLAEGWAVIALIRSDFPADDPQLREARQQRRLRVYHADLSDFASLRPALNDLKAQETAIDVLFNNAGISLGQLRDTAQGRDIHFEVNTLVPYILLEELLPLVEKGQRRLVVNTSSNGLLYVKAFDPPDLEHPRSFVKLTGPYSASKLALSLWTQALAPALAQQGISILSVCPGPCKTPMTAGEGMPTWLRLLRHVFFASPATGAGRLYTAAREATPGEAGVFLNKGKPMPLPFAKHQQAVLKKVQLLYEQDYLEASRPASV